MAFSFKGNLKKYEEGFKCIKVEAFCDEDIKIFNNKALCVQGTFSKEFKLFGTEDGVKFVSYLPCNPACTAELNRYYPLTDIVVQTLERSGEIKHRAILKSDLGL